ncbi:hypothetical protein HDU97_006433 [Phlyctochytrium planicorne]|nr:hypothetical protein HDU97_006433 [Phlyctochytrium planicorne]
MESAIYPSFVSGYVRSVASSNERRRAILESLVNNDPHVEMYFSAVIMVDISGYSKITSRLAEHGRVSSELITQAMGDYLNKIIEVIENHGGDVIKFLGDAILAVFRHNDDSPMNSTSSDPQHPSFNIEEKTSASTTSKKQESTTAANTSNSETSMFTVEENALRCCLQIMTEHPFVTLDSSFIQRLLKQSSVAPPSQVNPRLAAALSSSNIAEDSQFGTLHEGALKSLAASKSMGMLAIPAPSGQQTTSSNGNENGTSTTAASAINIFEDLGIPKYGLDGGKTDIHLKHHIAITSGMVSFAVLGKLKKRLDLVVYGSCFESLEELIGSAKPGSMLKFEGECAIHYDTYETIFGNPDEKDPITGKPVTVQPLWAHKARYDRKGIVIDTALASEVSQTFHSLYNPNQQQSSQHPSQPVHQSASYSTPRYSVQTKRDRMGSKNQVGFGRFSVASSQNGGAHGSFHSGRDSESSSGNIGGYSGGGFKMVSEPPMMDVPIIEDVPLAAKLSLKRPRINYGTRALEFMKKFVNEAIAFEISSRIHPEGEVRASTSRRKEVEDGLEKSNDPIPDNDVKAFEIKSQYRSISIVFIRLVHKFEPNLAQHALSTFLRSLEMFQGIFQQFAVDDKGQTMLACFGLPPFTHRNTAASAIDAALEFQRMFTQCPIQISITSGDILFARLGNERRSEASLLGDVVNIASRLLSISKDTTLVCDTSTKQKSKVSSVTTSTKFRSLGAFFLKGSVRPVEAWGIELPSGQDDVRDLTFKYHFTDTGPTPDLGVGYSNEKQVIMDLVEERTKKFVIVVEGISGMGKTTFLDSITKGLHGKSVDFCLTKAVERDHLVPFSTIRNLIVHILHSELSSSTQEAPKALSSLKRRASFVVWELSSNQNLSPPSRTASTTKRPPELRIPTELESPSPRKTAEKVVFSAKTADKSNFSSKQKSVKSRRPSNSSNPFFASSMSSIHTENSELQFSSTRAPVAVMSTLATSNTNLSMLGLDASDSSANGGLINAILSMLGRLGEEKKMLPLFQILLPGLKVPETEETKDVAGNARTVALRTLLTRVLYKWADTNDTVFLFDDIQWMDSVSLDIIDSALKQSSKMFLILAMRPSQVLQSMDSLGNGIVEMTSISLKGFSPADVEEFLKSRFPGVARVQKDLVNVLHEKSGASPLTLQIMAQFLTSDDFLQVQDDELGFHPTKTPMVRQILENSISQSILSQFDKLHSSFRDFLLKACIFGQYFDLVDIEAISDDPNCTVETLSELIFRYDTFNFIECLDLNTPHPTLFFFRHISFSNSIYDTLSFSERSILHRRAGEVYESRLDPANRDLLLPTLAMHYSLSDCHSKHVDYMEELAFHYLSKGYYREGGTILKELISFANASEDLLGNDKLRIAAWNAYLAGSACTSYQCELVDEAAKRALHLIGIKIPATERQAMWYAIKGFYRHYRILWKFHRWLKHGKPFQTGPDDEPLEATRVVGDMAFFALNYISLSTSNSTPFRTLYMFMEHINMVALNAPTNLSKWVVRAMQAGAGCRLQSRALSNLYYASGVYAFKKCNDVDLMSAIPYYMMYLMAELKFDEAVYWNDVFKRIAIQRAEIVSIQASTNFEYILQRFGSHMEAEEQLLEFLEEATLQDTYVGDQGIYCLMEIAILQGDVPKASMLISRAQKLRDRLECETKFYSPQAATQTEVGGVWMAVLQSNIEEAVRRLEKLSEAVKQLTNSTSHYVTAMSFGYMGLWFLFPIIDDQGAAVAKDKKGRIAEALRSVKGFIRKFQVGNKYLSLFNLLFLSSYYLSMGKKSKALRYIDKLLHPSNAMQLEIWDRKLLGLGYAARWLLRNSRESITKACFYFEQGKCKFWANWIMDVKPLSGNW